MQLNLFFAHLICNVLVTVHVICLLRVIYFAVSESHKYTSICG